MTPTIPQPIQPASGWVIVMGAIFGAITLIALFVFAFLAGTSTQQFVCKSFQLLAAAFSLGAALSAAFLGGGAAAQGTSRAPLSIAFGVGGGVAVLLIMFVVFSQFKPACSDGAETISEAVSRSDAALQKLKDMQSTLDSALKAAKTSAANFSDARTCSRAGGEGAGLIQGAEKSRVAIIDDLNRISTILTNLKPAGQ